MAFGSALAFGLGSAAEIRGLRISPLAVVTFARAGERTSVNNDTIYSSAPTCELGSMLRDVLMRVLCLRQAHGRHARIALCRVDVKDAFRQVPVDPAGAPVSESVAGGHVVVDLRLQFGWRNSPGFWGVVTSALEYSRTRSTFKSAVVPRQGQAAVAHVVVALPRGGPVVTLPGDCQPVPGTGGNTGSCVCVRYYVEDGIIVELQWWPDGCRCQRAVKSLASDHFRRWGERGVSDPPFLTSLTGILDGGGWVGSLTLRPLQ